MFCHGIHLVNTIATCKHKFIFLVVVKTQASTVSDKVKNRLEQLDDFEEVINGPGCIHLSLRFINCIARNIICNDFITFVIFILSHNPEILF